MMFEPEPSACAGSEIISLVRLSRDINPNWNRSKWSAKTNQQTASEGKKKFGHLDEKALERKTEN